MNDGRQPGRTWVVSQPVATRTQYRIAYECESHAGDYRTWYTQVVEDEAKAAELMERHDVYANVRMEVRTVSAWTPA